MEVYVNDFLVKSKEPTEHLVDLREYFMVRRKYKMKLNLTKCVFEVDSGRSLGFIVSEKCIEANTEKINAILDMKPPQNINETQRLVGRVTALNRFVSRSIDKCLRSFRVMRKIHPWNEGMKNVIRLSGS